jgi:hypothetical protein
MVPERPPLEIASAVNKVFIIVLSASVKKQQPTSGGSDQAFVSKEI